VATVVAIMDRHGFEANTDNVVLVEPEQSRLLWIPRDLWCDAIPGRINAAFRRGGHALLLGALREHGFEASSTLVLSREATEAALTTAVVVVPVPVRMVFDYPLAPTERIEDGRKEICFDPPAEALRGERIHQWIGARGGSDLHRIERQKIFVRRLLERRFDFRRALADPRWVRAAGDSVLDDLSRVASGWRFETFADVTPMTIGGQMALVVGARAASGPARAGRGWLNRPRWMPVDAPATSVAAARSRDALLAVVGQFEVVSAPRYQPGVPGDAAETCCNIFTWDVTRALRAEVPHWVDDAGRPVAAGHGREMSANATVRWLETHGAAHGWREGTAAEAEFAAASGAPALAVWLNTDGHGHVAVVVPAREGAGVHIAQAGTSCFDSGPLAQGFGDHPVRFFLHE
jgi:hypothetical protein